MAEIEKSKIFEGRKQFPYNFPQLISPVSFLADRIANHVYQFIKLIVYFKSKSKHENFGLRVNHADKNNSRRDLALDVNFRHLTPDTYIELTIVKIYCLKNQKLSQS